MAERGPPDLRGNAFIAWTRAAFAAERSRMAERGLPVFALPLLIVVTLVIQLFGAEPFASATPYPPLLVSFVSAAFFLTWLAGSFRNGPPRQRLALERCHALATLVFLIMLSMVCATSPSRLWNEASLAGLVVLAIHGARWWIEFQEMRYRKGPVRADRHLLEASSYLVVITCALLGAASQDKRLILVGIGLSLLMIFREVKFRAYDELWERLHPTRTAPPRAAREPVPFPLAVADMFVAKFFKSMVYIGVGFALLYENLAEYYGVDETMKLTSPSENVFLDYLYFSLGMLHHNAYGDVSPVSVLAKSLAAAEQVISSLMFTVVVALMIEAVNERYRKRDDPRGRG